MKERGISVGDMLAAVRELFGPPLRDRMVADSNAFRRVASERGLRAAMADPGLRASAVDIAGNLDFTGIFGGVKAATAPLGALNKAKELAKAGGDAPSIWKETGWFKGPDGEWRFEIDDSGAKLNYPADKWGFNRDGEYPQTVGDFLDHPGLFGAYPDEAATQFSQKAAHGKLAGERGSYAPGDASAPPRLTIATFDPPEARSTTLHELQHAVQDREGFASGGGPHTAVEMRDELLAQIQPLRDRINRIRMGQEKADSATLYALEDQLKPLDRAYDRLARERAMDTYRRLAGEAEARLVQKRQDYTPEQRRAIFPLDELDVPVEELIIRRGIELGR